MIEEAQQPHTHSEKPWRLVREGSAVWIYGLHINVDQGLGLEVLLLVTIANFTRFAKIPIKY